MKIRVLKFFLSTAAVLGLTFTEILADSIDVLENGTPKEKMEMMYNMGYSGNVRGFWYFVKYLDYLPNGNESPDSIKMREAAAEALGRIKYEPAVKYLVERYEKEKQVRVKTRIIFALSFYNDEKAFPVIKDALSSSNRDLKFEALLTAAKYKSPEFKTQIESDFSQSKDVLMKSTAAYGLYLLEPKREYVDYLLEGLKERSPETRYWSAHYLRLIGDYSVIPQLVSALKIENRFWVRDELEQAVYSLYDRKREVEKSDRDARFEFLVN